MSYIWDQDKHYFAKLATYAAELKQQTGEHLAMNHIAAHIDGRILDEQQIIEAMKLEGISAPELIEEQITITAHVHEPPGAKSVMDKLAGPMFNIIERGERVPPTGATSRQWVIAHLSPIGAPANWPDRWSDDLRRYEYPSAFTLEVISWPSAVDLGRVFVIRSKDVGPMIFSWGAEEE